MQSAWDFGYHTRTTRDFVSSSLSRSLSLSIFHRRLEIGSRYITVNPIDQKFAHVLQRILTVRRDIESPTYSASRGRQPVDVFYVSLKSRPVDERNLVASNGDGDS